MGEHHERTREVCLNFCVYYKPGKDEEVACLGFLVIRKLIEGGRDLDLTKRPEETEDETGRLLCAAMCSQCPFYPADCDHILKDGDAAPCGGLAALRGLINAKIITIDEVREAIAPVL